jgi:uncharacterized protein YybS (DUF2232 family)
MLKDIANGVLITSLIFFISILIPIVGFFCSLFIPLPTLFYRIKLGRATSAFIPVLGFIIMAVVLRELTLDVFFLGQMLLIGFILGELLESQFSVEKTLLFACSAAVLIGFVSLLIVSVVSASSPVSILTQYVEKNLELSLRLYQSMGMSAENIRLFESSMKKILYFLVRIIPALTVASTLFVVWINVLLAKALLKGKTLLHPDYGKLNSWQAPDVLIWAVIGCGLLMMIPDSAIKLIGLNGLLILLTIYFFQGIAIVAFFFDKKQLPRFFRILFYSLIALQQILLLVVIAAGLFDIWLDFRKLKKIQT